MCKHAPKFYVRLAEKPVYFPGNFTVYTGSLYGRFEQNGKQIFWVCDDFKKGNMRSFYVHVFSGAEWKIESVKPGEKIYNLVTLSLRKLGRVPVVEKETITFHDAQNMMKHSSIHKKGSGSRINTYQINQPLKWNEVTELAHWYGKGNASVVASNIR